MVAEVTSDPQKGNAFRRVLLDLLAAGGQGYRNKSERVFHMYPFIRMAKELWKFRKAPPLTILEPHISTHRIWPQDLDIWVELNNGRTLTLFDLGRMPMARRMGFDKIGRAKGWGLTVAGNSTRYRKRVTLFQKLTQVSRIVGWDARFVYLEQSFWRGDDCTAHMLLRSAFISKAGMVPPEQVLAALNQSQPSPPLPDWVTAWIDAEAERPWPPQR
jgi:acyl-CoA thioesterase FadM